MKIVFMGTPEFAVTSLKALLEAGYQIVGVVTAPDSMGGRGGHQLIQSEVKKYALSQGLLILQPVNLKSKAFLGTLRSLKADLQVVVAFRMLPEVVWNMPPLGTINVHGSLLPKYRGAAPIHWAVMQGEQETGVTIFKLKQEIDTGDIIAQSKLSISPDETTGMVYGRLMQLGAETLVTGVVMIENETFVPIKQNDEVASTAPKLYHETCEIAFSKSMVQIHNFIRGLNPKPTAWMRYGGIKYFIHLSKTTTLTNQADKPIGALMIQENKLYLNLNDGMLQILEIQPEGKRKMTTPDFINGVRNNPDFN